MASFNEHVTQAKSNLAFLVNINQIEPPCWDWQITSCFYIAVHLVNAHLAHVANLHYQTHEQVKHMLNPNNSTSLGRLTEAVYLDYVKLEGLSRRSRYLCAEVKDPMNAVARLTYDKHFAKAIKCLDRLIIHFNDAYSMGFAISKIKCDELKRTPLTMFQVI